MQKNKISLALLGAGILTSALLTGCGGGGGGGSTAANILTPGAVLDGYLVGAKVCLDINANGKCDDGEPSDTTKAHGVYSLSSSAADAAKYSIVAEVTAATVDEDTNAVVAKPYILMSPPGAKSSSGQAYVTPLTTLMQNSMALNPNLKVVDAENEVKSQLGYAPDHAVSLLEDHVAKAEASADADYIRIRQISQVTARVIADNKEALDLAAKTANLAPLTSTIMQKAVADVAAQLANIQVVADAADNFDAKGVIKPAMDKVGTISAAKTAYSNSTVKTDLDKMQLAASATKVDALVTLKEGTYNFWVNTYTSTINNVTSTLYQLQRSASKVDTAGTQTSFKDEKYIPGQNINASTGWRPYASTDLVLVNGGWQSSADNNCTLESPLSDGSINFTCGVREAGNASFSVMPVDGLNVADYLEQPEAKDAYTPGAKFSADAKIVKGTFKQSADFYRIGVWQDCGGWSGVNGNCNAVSMGWSGQNQSTGYIATLAQLLQITDPNLIGIGSSFYRLGVVFSGTSKTGVVGDSGAATFYTGALGGNLTTALPISGAWKVVSVGGQTLLMVEIPPAYKYLSSESMGSRTLFFAVENGVVRRGELTRKDSPETEMNYNSIAAQDMLNAFVVAKAAP